jgi:hypothetical protein
MPHLYGNNWVTTQPESVIWMYLMKIYFDENQQWKALEDPLEILIKIIETIRPKKPSKVETVQLTLFIEFLKSHETIQKEFSNYLTTLFFEKRLYKILTDAGILQDIDF